MKNLFLILMTTAIFQFPNPQKKIENKGLCKVDVYDVSRMVSFGYLVGYTLEIKNNSRKTVDGIWWKADYYNNANELIKSDQSSFNSTNLVDPIAVGFTKSIVRTPRIKGASKVVIVITKVHFADDTTCR